MVGSSSKALTASREHVVHCFDVLVAELTAGGLAQVPGPQFENGFCPLFVTWTKSAQRQGGEGRLRGCIGCLEPKPLHTGVRDYALTSALRDRRFAPIEPHELPQLSCTVSLLARFERAAHAEDWELGQHGLLLEFSDPVSGARRTGTFLPEVALHQQWSQLETLEHLVRKAGYTGPAADVLQRLASPGGGAGSSDGVGSRGGASSGGAYVRLTRYQSTTCTLSYHDYVRLRDAAGDGDEPFRAAAAVAAEEQGSSGGKATAGRRLVTVPA